MSFSDRLEESKITAHEAEAYAQGVADVLRLIGWDGNSKFYDPLTIDTQTKVAHSYAFNLWDGGRHHPYESLEQIVKTIRWEACQWVIDEELLTVGEAEFAYMKERQEMPLGQ